MGEGSEKGQWPLSGLWRLVQEEAVPSSCPDARHYSFSLYATGALSAAALVLESRGSKFALNPKSVVVPLRGDA